MAATTINPYRFGGQLGYRRDGTNRNYVRARHLDTNKGRWISRDPIPLDTAGFNFYWISRNNPVTNIDPSGLAPEQGLPYTKCPAAIQVAVTNLCKGINSLGGTGIKASGCCTGQSQSDCLVTWCQLYSKNILCVDATKTTLCPSCAFTISYTGHQHPGLYTYICLPNFFQSRCNYGTGRCKSINILQILHERMHACGSGETGGFPAKDPAENRARCLCGTMGL